MCQNLNIEREVDNVQWLHYNILHTPCISHVKVCDVIIDEYSFENVVSTIMVEISKLKTKDHLQSYKLSWLDKKNESKVSKHCLVQFFIGKEYIDEVTCDVISMDACHLLLERH